MMFGSFPEDLLEQFKRDYAERQAFAVGYPVQTFSYAKKRSVKGREAQTNMPSRGMPSTFNENKVGWVMDGDKPKLASEENKVPPPAKKGGKQKALPKGTTQPGVSQSTLAAQQKGAALASNKQVNRAGRDAQMRNLQKLNTQRLNPG